MKRCALLLLACWLVWSASARAAVVQLHRADSLAPDPAELLIFTGLPGETNLISVAPGPPGSVLIRDAGASMIPGANCTGGAFEVTCSGIADETKLRVLISATDADDRITLDGSLAYSISNLNGGSGNDVVVGGSGVDGITGARGDDLLDGAGGDDALEGNEGADSIHGGSGVDTATWSGEEPVSVTLNDRPDDGSPGEQDNAWTDVENLTGGSGPNRLVGSDGPNVLIGGRSTNELWGGGGDDVLVAGEGKGGRSSGGPGRDRIDPSPDDAVDVRDGEADRVECLRGLRRAARIDAVDELIRCAPEVRLGSTRAVMSAAGLIELRFECRAIGRSCSARVVVSVGRRVIARETVKLKPGKVRATIRLNRRGRELVERRRRLTTVVEARGFTVRSESLPSVGQVVLRRG